MFAATDQSGSRLWLRRLDQAATQPLAGTDGAAAPFWSPDSRAIGFFANGNLYRLDIRGGAPRMLANAAPGASGYRGGSWSRTDVILFVSGNQLFRIAANGGEAIPMPLGPNIYFPYFLPDGRRFLFFSNTAGISLGSVDGGDEPKRLVPAYSSGGYVPPGLVFYVRQGALEAGRFDEARGELVGDPTVVADPVGAVRRIYAHWGRELSPVAEARIRESLSKKGIEVKRLDAITPSMEDVFVALTKAHS